MTCLPDVVFSSRRRHCALAWRYVPLALPCCADGPCVLAPAGNFVPSMQRFASVADIPSSNMTAAMAVLNMKRVPAVLPSIQMEVRPFLDLLFFFLVSSLRT